MLFLPADILTLDNIEYLLEHTPKSSSVTYSKRLAKFILFVYNTVQLTLEILLIMVVLCTYSFWWKGNVSEQLIISNLDQFAIIEDTDHNQTFTCGKMIAHYLFFLSLVNQFAFFCIACIFATLTKIKSDWGAHEQHSPLVKFRHFIFPILNWSCIKSNHHYISNIWIQSIVTMISPITYFYTIAKPGNVHYFIHYVSFLMFNGFSYFPGSLDIALIRQCQRTLLIFNGILLIVNAIWFLLDLAQEDQDLTLTIIGSTSMALIVVGLIKTYIKEFVNLDKM